MIEGKFNHIPAPSREEKSTTPSEIHETTEIGKVFDMMTFDASGGVDKRSRQELETLSRLCFSKAVDTLTRWKIEHRNGGLAIGSHKIAPALAFTPPGGEEILVEIKLRKEGRGEVDVMRWGKGAGQTIKLYELPKTVQEVQDLMQKIVEDHIPEG